MTAPFVRLFVCLGRRLRLGACLVLAVHAFGIVPAAAQRYETGVGSALLIDRDTGTVLFEKGADTPFPPANLAKLVTMAVVFRALQEGRLKLDDTFLVSENAWRTGGAMARVSTMFAALGSNIAVADLIRGAIVQLGNDSCIILAEGMAGTEEAFADLMNEEAARIGMTDSRFVNATGLPAPDQQTTARDIATLATHLMDNHPYLYLIFSEPDFTWNKIFQRNRNPLLAMNIGADGLMTGFAEEAGYQIVGSARRDGQRLIMVIGGAESEKARADEARKLIEWGFRAFERVRLFAEGEIIAQARVFNGETRTVGVVGNQAVNLLLPVGLLDLVRAEVVYSGPIPAPVTAGQAVGVVRFTTAEGLSKEQAVFAAEDVGVGSLPQRALDGLEEMLLGWW